MRGARGRGSRELQRPTMVGRKQRGLAAAFGKLTPELAVAAWVANNTKPIQGPVPGGRGPKRPVGFRRATSSVRAEDNSKGHV